jgi:hypothetical protein
MTVELNDEVPVPGFEDNLWRELARVHEQERVDAPSGGITRRRGLGRRTLLAGAGSIAAATVLIAGILVAGPDEDARDEDDLQARIIAATETALTDSIVHDVSDWAMTPGPVDAEFWADQTSLSVRMLSYNEDGEVSLDWGLAEVPSQDGPSEALSGTRLLRTVDYCFQEYSIEEESEVFPGREETVEASVVLSIVEELERGSMREDGTQVVDGRELIRVVEDGETASDATWLVDPETYRPVQLIGDLGEGAGGYVTTFEYLPRTPANLALLRAADPPDGFVLVDELFRRSETRPCV